jgi:hypothetical protein
MSEPTRYKVTTYDTDLVGLTQDARELALRVLCTCGHPRSAHLGATGALASFGGSACERCWTCATFRADVR